MLMVNNRNVSRNLSHRADAVTPSSEIYNANIEDLKQWEFMCVVATLLALLNRLSISFQEKLYLSSNLKITNSEITFRKMSLNFYLHFIKNNITICYSLTMSLDTTFIKEEKNQLT